MNGFSNRFDCSRDMDGVFDERSYGSEVKGRVSVTFGSGKRDNSPGVWGLRFAYRFTAMYSFRDKDGELHVVKLSEDYASASAAWNDVDRYASAAQREIALGLS